MTCLLSNPASRQAMLLLIAMRRRVSLRLSFHISLGLSASSTRSPKYWPMATSSIGPQHLGWCSTWWTLASPVHCCYRLCQVQDNGERICGK